MSFDPLEKIEGATATRAVARASLAMGKQATRARLVVSLSAEIAEKIGATEKSKFEVLIGRGTDHGILRLRKNNSAGIVSPHRLKCSLVFNLGHIADYPNRREKAAPCMAEVLDQATIEVVLPRWADRKQAAAVAPAVTAPKPAIGASVGGAIMGDPPRGRSALDQKRARGGK